MFKGEHNAGEKYMTIDSMLINCDQFGFCSMIVSLQNAETKTKRFFEGALKQSLTEGI